MGVLITFHHADFVASYISVFVFFALYLGWKIVFRTKWIKPAEADILTGKAALDAEDAHWPEQIPRNWVERFWYWLA